MYNRMQDLEDLDGLDLDELQQLQYLPPLTIVPSVNMHDVIFSGPLEDLETSWMNMPLQTDLFQLQPQQQQQQSPLSPADSACSASASCCHSLRPGSFAPEPSPSSMSADGSRDVFRYPAGRAAVIQPLQSGESAQQAAMTLAQQPQQARTSRRGRRRLAESTTTPMSRDEERRQRRRASNRRAAERYREKQKASADDIKTAHQLTAEENTELKMENEHLRRVIAQLQQQLQQQQRHGPQGLQSRGPHY